MRPFFYIDDVWCVMMLRNRDLTIMACTMCHQEELIEKTPILPILELAEASFSFRAAL